MASEVEDTLKRIQSHRGVIGTIVVNSEGLYSSTDFILLV
jgi:dynein light chain roadblock-type